MSMLIDFKSNKSLMALRTLNSFGDQIIVVVDLSKENDKEKDSDFPYVAGKIIFKHVDTEGGWTNFTEKDILKIMPAQNKTNRIKYYASKVKGWAYGDQWEESVKVFDSLDEALDHAISGNYYDPDDNTICAGYLAEILADQDVTDLATHPMNTGSDDLGQWFAQDVLVATGKATKKDFFWRYGGNF